MNQRRLRSLRFVLPIGLGILVVAFQLIFDSSVPMNGAAYVDSDQDEQFLDSKSDRMDWDEVYAWSPEQKVAGFRNHDRIYTSQAVQKGDHPFILPTSTRELTRVHYRLWNYQVHFSVVPLYKEYDLDDFILHNNITGLIVIKSGEIVLERYQAGNSNQTRWGSMSVTKSILSLLVGAAITDGHIQGTDVRIVDYLPVLKGTSYEPVTIEHLLRMSSGVEWNLDEANPDWETARSLTFTQLVEYLGSKNRYSDPGESFNYNDAEVNLLGAALSAAVGEDLSTYLEQKIWQPFGMEADASWMTYPDGPETGACCLSATLRDYGRLGLYAMRNGQLADGSSALPDGWMQQSTSPSINAANYGFLWWLRGGGSYAAMGIYGQLIYIDPTEEIVIAAQSTWSSPSGDEYHVHLSAFIQAVTEALR